MSLNSNSNLGWHFHRNYFIEDDGSLMNLKSDNLKSDATEKKFNQKNKAIEIIAYNISYFSSSKNALKLYTTYPGLLTGSGNVHEVSAKGEMKLGFSFDYTTGLPFIPGSTLKGMLRSVFPDLKKGKLYVKNTAIDELKVAWLLAQIENINQANFLEEFYNPKENICDEEVKQIALLTYEIFEGIKDFEAKKDKEKLFSIYERDIFYDAYIVESGKDGKIVGTDYITPHREALKNPTPLPFLKVLPNVAFQFNFDLKDSKVIPLLTKENKELLFKKILLTIGVGAKTNVGYGQFSTKKLTITENVESTTGQEQPSRTRQEGNFHRQGNQNPHQSRRDSDLREEQLYIKNENLQKGQVVKGKVEKKEGDRLNFKVFIEGYEKLGFIQSKEFNIGDYIEVKINITKEDGTYTFKDAKKYQQKGKK